MTKISQYRFFFIFSMVLFVTVIFFSFAHFSSFVNYVFAATTPVAIDTSANTTGDRQDSTGHSLVFISDLVGYSFYVDSTGGCVYSKTTDGGANWGSAVSTLGAQIDCRHTVVWYDQWTPGDTSGTYIHIANLDWGDDDLWYTRLDTSDDSISTEVTITDAHEGGANWDNRPYASITKGTDGDIYAGTHSDGSDGDDTSYIVKCTTTCTDNSNWGDAGTTPLDSATSVDQLSLIPLAGGDILVIRWDSSDTDMDSKVYDDSEGTWDAGWTDIDTSCSHIATRAAPYAATVDKSTNDVYLAYGCGSGSDVGDLRTAIYSGGSWSTKAEVVSDVHNLRDATIALDQNSGDVYAAYSEEFVSPVNKQRIYYKVSTDNMASWGAVSDAVDTEPDERGVYGVSLNAMSDERIGLFWFEDGVYDVFYSTLADLVANSAPTAIAISPSQTSQSIVTVTTTVADADSDVTSLLLEYSLDNSTWVSSTLATVTETESIDGVVTSTGSITDIDTDNDGSVTFTTIEWDVATDIPNTDDTTVYFRIIPNDGTENGATATSSAFTVDTKVPTAPGALTVNSTSTTSVILNFGATTTDNGFAEYKIFYKAGASGVTTGDTAFTSSSDANLGSVTFGGASTTTISGLSVNTQYVANIYAYDAWGNVTGASSEVAFYTLANAPGTPTGTGVSSSSIQVGISTNGNPSNTLYALHVPSTPLYINTDGTVTTTPIYQTSSTWDGIASVGLSANTQYSMEIYAKNGDGVVTAVSPSVSTYTLAAPAGIPTVSAASTTAVNITIDANGNPSSTIYAVKVEGTSFWLEDDLTTTSTPVYQTTSTWGSPIVFGGLSVNDQYGFSVVARNGDNVNSATSSLAAAYTLANTPGTPTVTGASTSSVGIIIDTNSNPAATIYALHVYDTSQYVDASGAPTTTAVYQTSSTWDGITLGSLSINDQYGIDVIAKNGDGTETATSSLAAAYTLANPASAPTIGTPTTSTLPITINVNSNPAATTYAVYNSTDSTYLDTAGAATTTAVYSTTSTLSASFAATGLSPNTAYQFTVVARNGDSTDAATSTASTATYTLANAASAPTIGTPTTSTLPITINTNSNSAATTYALYNSTDGNYLAASGASNGETPVYQTTSTWGSSFAASGLTPNSSYQFTVIARNGGSVNAATSTASTAAYTTSVEPSAISATANGQTSMIVSWTDDANASGSVYQLYNITTSAVVATTSNKTYTVTGLTAETSYTFKVRTQYASDTDSYSSYTSASSAVSTGAISTSVSMTLSVGASSTFKLTVLGDTHTVTLVSSDGTTVTTTIESTPQTVGLTQGESTTIDTDDDGADDLQVTADSVSADSATLSLALYTPPSSGSSDDSSSSNGSTPGVSPPASPTNGLSEFVIHGGLEETENEIVTLTLNSPDAALMALSNSSDFSGTSYVSYSDTYSWALLPGNGGKTVYVKLRTAQGGEKIVTDSIVLTGQGFDAEDLDIEINTSGCELVPGKAYKAAFTSAVFYVGEAHNLDGTIDETKACAKRPFATAQKYFTYFDSWSEVTVTTKTALDSVPDDVLGFMPEGPKYDPKYGALVKVVTDPKVYLLLGTNKYWITSETVFEALNYSWNWIEDVAASLLDKYTSAGEIDYTDHHPSYTLIKYEDDSKVYRLEPDPADETKQVKRHIADEATFVSLNFRWDRIVTISDTEVYETGNVLSNSVMDSTDNAKDISTDDVFVSFLETGSDGDEVLALQILLQQEGFFLADIDPNGYYGPVTTEAVTAFQRSEGIAPLGYVGPATRAALNAL